MVGFLDDDEDRFFGRGFQGDPFEVVCVFREHLKVLLKIKRGVRIDQVDGLRVARPICGEVLALDPAYDGTSAKCVTELAFKKRAQAAEAGARGDVYLNSGSFRQRQQIFPPWP